MKASEVIFGAVPRGRKYILVSNIAERDALLFVQETDFVVVTDIGDGSTKTYIKTATDYTEFLSPDVELSSANIWDTINSQSLDKTLVGISPSLHKHIMATETEKGMVVIGTQTQINMGNPYVVVTGETLVNFDPTAPIPNDIITTVAKNTSVLQGTGVTINALTGITDPEGDKLILQGFSSDTPASDVQVSIVDESNLYIYPHRSFRGPVVVTYVFTDGTDSYSGVLNIDVTELNKPPVTVDRAYTSLNGSTKSISITDFVTDPNTTDPVSSLTIAFTKVSGGDAVINRVGDNIEFTSTVSGPSTWKFVAQDDSGAQSIGYLTFHVSSNRPPHTTRIRYYDSVYNKQLSPSSSHSNVAASALTTGITNYDRTNAVDQTSAFFYSIDLNSHTIDTENDPRTATAFDFPTSGNTNSETFFAPGVYYFDNGNCYFGKSAGPTPIRYTDGVNNPVPLEYSLGTPVSTSVTVTDNVNYKVSKETAYHGDDLYETFKRTVVSSDEQRVVSGQSNDSTETSYDSHEIYCYTQNTQQLALGFVTPDGDGKYHLRHGYIQVASDGSTFTYTPNNIGSSDQIIESVSINSTSSSKNQICITKVDFVLGNYVNLPPIIDISTPLTVRKTDVLNLDVNSLVTDLNADDVVTITLSAVDSNTVIDSTGGVGSFQAIQGFVDTIGEGLFALSYVKITATDGVFTTEANLPIQVYNITEVLPVANDDSATTVKNVPVTISVLDNDFDANGNTITIQNIGIGKNPDNGSISHDGVEITYVPNLNFVGDDSFTYEINDGVLPTNVEATVNVSVTEPPETNDAPYIVQVPTITMEEGTKVEVDPTKYARDPDGDALALLSTGITSGPVTSSVLGSQRLEISSVVGDANTSSVVNYSVTDGNFVTNGNININVVEKINQVPVILDNTVHTDYQNTITFTPSVLDAEGDDWTIESVSNGSHGSVTFTGKQLTYSPTIADNFYGQDQFNFYVKQVDNDKISSAGVVTVVVNKPDDITMDITYNAQAVDNIEHVDDYSIVVSNLVDNQSVIASYTTSSIVKITNQYTGSDNDSSYQTNLTFHLAKEIDPNDLILVYDDNGTEIVANLVTGIQDGQRFEWTLDDKVTVSANAMWQSNPDVSNVNTPRAGIPIVVTAREDVNEISFLTSAIPETNTVFDPTIVITTRKFKIRFK